MQGLKVGDCVSAAVEHYSSYSQLRFVIIHGPILDINPTTYAIILVPKGTISIGWTKERINIFNDNKLSACIRQQFDPYQVITSYLTLVEPESI